MNWEVEFTDQAKQDLRDILDYITYELQEPKVAVNLVRQITKEIPCLYSSIRKSFFQAQCTQPEENRLFLSDFDHSFFSFLLHLFQKANMFKTANK